MTVVHNQICPLDIELKLQTYNLKQQFYCTQMLLLLFLQQIFRRLGGDNMLKGTGSFTRTEEKTITTTSTSTIVRTHNKYERGHKRRSLTKHK